MLRRTTAILVAAATVSSPGYAWEPVRSGFAFSSALTGKSTPRTRMPNQGFFFESSGTLVCASCHQNTHAQWAASVHAIRLPGNVPLGHAGAECQDCHGNSVAHATFFDDPNLRPPADTESSRCGQCHTGAERPQYEEWQQSFHGRVTPAVAEKFLKVPQKTLRTCGACHSGAVRLALLQHEPLPGAGFAAHQSVGCAVCHDPHVRTRHPAQLRYPVASTNFFSFTGAFNTSISVCGQCHNARGSSWKDTAEYPHSPQYNVYLGNLGVISGPPQNSFHRQISRQCVNCHVFQESPAPSEIAERGTGHTFWPQFNNCQPCHTEQEALSLVLATQEEFRGLMDELKSLLDSWGENHAPVLLRTNYGPLAWEYTQPGPLSNPGDDPTIRGPTAQEQKLVPDEIKQARFNLYLVYRDKSQGVHNGTYERQLLRTAQEKVNLLTDPP
jgi:hypothetical protein